MWTKVTVVLGKLISFFVRMFSGGTAFPGLIVETINPRFLSDILQQAPMGVVVITGTNGKTTTTKLAVEMLQAHGLKVFTNPSGSNFTRGVISSLLSAVKFNGQFNYDIAVLELDEAYSVQFAKRIRPDFCMILNLFRDQLDRYGELDTTSKMLESLVRRTRQNVILNREDPYVSRLATAANSQVVYFGVNSRMRLIFKNDEDLYSSTDSSFETPPFGKTDLTSYSDGELAFNYDHQAYSTRFNLIGAHNALNAVAAICLVAEILKQKFRFECVFKVLEEIKPAFGRGEIIKVGDKTVQLMLVKNPASFHFALQDDSSSELQRIIMLGDEYADGRDVSWIWDVDFKDLIHTGVDIVSGVRSFDMALRLLHDDVVSKRVIPEINRALNYALAIDKPVRVYCTYSCMLEARKALSGITNVEKIKL